MSTADLSSNPPTDPKALTRKKAWPVVALVLFAIALFQFIGATFAGRPPQTHADYELGIIWRLGVPIFFAILGLWAAFAAPKAPGVLGFLIYGILVLLDLMLCQQGPALIGFLALKAILIGGLIGAVQSQEKTSPEASKGKP